MGSDLVGVGAGVGVAAGAAGAAGAAFFGVVLFNASPFSFLRLANSCSAFSTAALISLTTKLCPSM